MKQTKSHQCKCHLKSESAFINSTATKCSAVSYISSCFVHMTANALITIVCRDVLINKSQLMSWQSAEHKALLAVDKPQEMLRTRVSVTRTLPAHPCAAHGWWPHTCDTSVWLTYFMAALAPRCKFIGISCPLPGVTMMKHKVLVGRCCSGCSPDTRVCQGPSAGLGHSPKEATVPSKGAFHEETLRIFDPKKYLLICLIYL